MEGAGDGGNSAGPKPVDTEQVLLGEYRLIHPKAEQATDLNSYYSNVQSRGQAALCLSGGGIRSAAFALGVIQALSRKKLLTGFHYLSTVSGGGYIGSWLQRWIHEEDGDADKVMVKLGGVREPDQIKRLRENSNFLTPRAGLGSNDTWTGIALTLRNILVNWFLFLPALLLVAMLPNWFLSGVASVPTADLLHPWFSAALLGIAAVAIAVSVFFTVPMLPSYAARYRIKPGSGDGWIFFRIVLPIIIWSVAGTLALSAQLFSLKEKADGMVWLTGAPLALATLGGMVVGWAAGYLRVATGHGRTFGADVVIWLLSFAVTAGWVFLGAQLFESAMTAPAGGAVLMEIQAAKDGVSRLVGDASWGQKMLTMLGPLWLMTATMMAAVVFAAFRWSEGRTVKPDADREWIARVSGIKFKPMLAWALAAFSVLLLGSLLRTWIGGELSLSAVVALIAGGGAVAGGRSGSSGDMVRKSAGRIWGFLPLQGLIALATLLFVVALFLLLGGLEAKLVDLIRKPVGMAMLAAGVPSWIDAAVVAHSILLVLLAFSLLFLGRLIPVNRFSLNGLYRNRLARGFLGAARARRAPNPFTGFDSFDNIRLHSLKPPGEAGRPLYPVINAALNVTSTDNLAWQERKAGPFVFTPLYSGSAMLDCDAPHALDPRAVTDAGTVTDGEEDRIDPPVRPHGRREGAYIDSATYAGSEPDLALGPGTSGVTLATAMTISGAAASPNMGYHSSPATAFLMTLFNVRLGAWLPNPALACAMGKHIQRSSPDNSLRALFRELAGSTDDKGWDIYLSDGGHFENLGIYEMLRRRCRYIFVSDAGADPDCAFTDLGNAVRKAKIDLDIDIDFGRTCISARTREIDPQLAWAMGRVRYPEGGEGAIIYVKPSFFGKHLPVDVVSYAADSLTFPHESTADQWFSESQFESYRRLGTHFAMQIGGGNHDSNLPDFFEQAFREYSAVIGAADRDKALMNALKAQLAWRPSSDPADATAS